MINYGRCALDLPHHAHLGTVTVLRHQGQSPGCLTSKILLTYRGSHSSSMCWADTEACPQSLQLVSPRKGPTICQMVPEVALSSDVSSG